MSGPILCVPIRVSEQSEILEISKLKKRFFVKFYEFIAILLHILKMCAKNVLRLSFIFIVLACNFSKSCHILKTKGLTVSQNEDLADLRKIMHKDSRPRDLGS